MLTYAREQKVGTLIKLQENTIRWMVFEALSVFKNEPVLLEIESPINVTGDFHGQFYDLLRLFEMTGGGPPK